jgi:hypothetical protein
MHEQIGLEWLNDVTPPQQQGLQAVAPDTDGYSTEEFLHHDELVQQLDGKAPSILLDQQANLRQQQVTHLENGSSSDDWLQELKPPRVAAAATAAAAGVRAPDSRLGNSSYDGALRTNSLQCMGIEPVSADAVAVAEGHVMGKEPTIAPDSDLMYIFRRSFAMPPFPGEKRLSCKFLPVPASLAALWCWHCQHKHSLRGRKMPQKLHGTASIVSLAGSGKPSTLAVHFSFLQRHMCHFCVAAAPHLSLLCGWFRQSQHTGCAL